MVLSRLGINDLIGKVSASYTGLIQTKNWEPAGRSADTLVVPRKFASSANAPVEWACSGQWRPRHVLQLWRTRTLLP
jgi:hypothetical protein